AGDPGHRAESFQIGAVAGGALHRFPAAVLRQRLALLDAADRRVSDESRARVAEDLGALRILRRLDDADADRLLLAALDRNPDAAAAHHLGHRGGLDDADPWCPWHRAEVDGGLL